MKFDVFVFGSNTSGIHGKVPRSTQKKFMVPNRALLLALPVLAMRYLHERRLRVLDH